MQEVLHKSEFVNEPLTDFSIEENKNKMIQALKQVKSELGKEYALVINGEKIYTTKKDKSINPSNISEVVGIIQEASIEESEKAIKSAYENFKIWKKIPYQERVNYLFKAADLMRKRKFYYAAWMIYEVGKSWSEADADVAEAIDFLEFYGREMVRYSQEQPLTRVPGERNKLIYIPLGVGVVIPPWNFPLAIMVGTTVSAIVTGNTVVLKPSSDAPVIAAKFVELMEEVGLPKGVINFITGDGAVIGDYLTSHHLTRFISFTGSMQVGLRINEVASKTRENQLWIKRVIAEMGGKDAIIVDNEADLDAAADGIVTSAFGFQGQKCSACSRAIVVESVYDEVVKKVIQKTKEKLVIGNPEELKNNYGPVSSKKAFNKILEYIEIGKKECELLLGGNKIENTNGYFIEPTIFGNVSPNSVLAQEEIFGPVLAFIKVKDFDKALEVANNTKYGLTGSVYSLNREKLLKAEEEFFVGNLYLNRKCTGALVGVHPFGGFNMSGTDSKAGGRDYLLLFMQAKSISEKIN